MYISITNAIRAVVKNDNSRVILTEFEVWHHHLLAVTLHKSVNFLSCLFLIYKLWILTGITS